MTIRVPEKFIPLRPVQEQAVKEIVELYNQGKRVVFWEAPTGSGKSVGGVAVAEALGVQQLLYICVGKQLQDQFARDFDCEVMKGRGNYPTLNSPLHTAADCTRVGRSSDCDWCESVGKCPYNVAKARAAKPPSGVTCINTALLLAECNYLIEPAFGGWDLCVLDEADEIEGELMRFLEFRVPRATVMEIGMEMPKIGVHKKTLAGWLGDGWRAAVKAAGSIAIGEGEEHLKVEKDRLRKFASRCAWMKSQVESDNWIRTYDSKGDLGHLTFKPASVRDYGPGYLWDHHDRWLCMSATSLSAEQMAWDMGLEDDEWGFVESESTFPVENRRVVATGIGDMGYRHREETLPKMAEALERVVELHEGENVLVHTHTYANAEYLKEELEKAGVKCLMYSKAWEREKVVEQFRRKGGVLLASSLERGVDLPDDLCRVVVICKVPFPYLKDRQIQKRMEMENGQTWYDMLTARAIVQMTGRGVRHDQDWAMTYILDGAFLKLIWPRKKWMFPQWWAEGVEVARKKKVLNGEVLAS